MKPILTRTQAVLIRAVCACLVGLALLHSWQPLTGSQLAQPQAALAAGTTVPTLSGIIPPGIWDASTLASQLTALDSWSGQHAALAGVYWDIEESVLDALPVQLNLLWNNGYTPFIFLTAGVFSNPTAAALAGGSYDSAISTWASIYKNWAGSERWAFIAPLPEMNSAWKDYTGDPDNYRLAFQRIRQIFDQQGVPTTTVRWVFAPEGASRAPFDAYYPGDANVDVVGFSALHYGYSTVYSADERDWKTPTEVLSPYVTRLRTIAPGKPIFITRLGTTGYIAAGQNDPAAKDQWLRDAYALLGQSLGVQAILYDNRNVVSEENWAVFVQNGSQFSGYRDGITGTHYGYLTPAILGTYNLTPQFTRLYMPVVQANFNACTGGTPRLLAVYTQGWPGTEITVKYQMKTLDTWSRKRLSMIGTYINIEQTSLETHVTKQLTLLWDSGYTPFVNLPTRSSLATINSGGLDTAIRAWARAYKVYAEGGGGRSAFIAPLQEMNGNWVPYASEHPAGFKTAYQRIRDIFNQEGVPPQSVRWTFAPNGLSYTSFPPFEAYYPGDSLVDVVAFSSYNYGYSPSIKSTYRRWETYEQIYRPYMDRMRLMAPSKPIVIAQTGTTAYYPNSSTYNIEAKNQWFRESLAFLSTYPGFLGLIYENSTNEQNIDWPFYIANDPATQFAGYADGVSNPSFCYTSPRELMYADLTVH